MTREDREAWVAEIVRAIMEEVDNVGGDCDSCGGPADDSVAVGDDRWQPVRPGLILHTDVLTLGPMRAYVYAWLVAHANRDGGVSISAADIARRASMGERSVNFAIRYLEAHGWMIVDRSGGNRAYRYRICR